MWEQTRSDGKKKLKCTAIPTIFGELVTQKVITREAGINRKFDIFNFYFLLLFSYFILQVIKIDNQVCISI